MGSYPWACTRIIQTRNKAKHCTGTTASEHKMNTAWAHLGAVLKVVGNKLYPAGAWDEANPGINGDRSLFSPNDFCTVVGDVTVRQADLVVHTGDRNLRPFIDGCTTSSNPTDN